LSQIIISPFGPKVFHYHIGNIHVDYDAANGSVSVSVPADGPRTFTITGLQHSSTFQLSTSGTCSSALPVTSVISDASGQVQILKAPAGVGCVLTVNAYNKVE
jgi:hypothetical protein